MPVFGFYEYGIVFLVTREFLYILYGKNKRSLCSLCSFLGYLTLDSRVYFCHLFQGYIFVTFFVIIFYEFFIKFELVFPLFKVIHRNFLWHFPPVQIVHIPLYKIWRFFVWGVSSHALIISFFVLMNCMTHSTSDTFI